MITKMIVPKFGLTMKEGQITAWVKAEGDPVAAGDGVVEVSTPKVTHVLESKGAGVLRKQLAPVGAVLPVGEVICLIADPEEELPEIRPKILRVEEPGKKEAGPPSHSKAEPSSASAGRPSKRVKISPVARKMAEKAGIDYSRIQGTGPGGRIVKADVENAMSGPPSLSEAAPPSATADRQLEITGIRKAVWQTMDLSARSVARVTHFAEVDLTNIAEFRKQSVGEFARKHSVRFTYTDVLVRLLALAMEANPLLNVYLEEEKLYRHDGIHIGLAVALEGGLIVGKIPHANRLGLADITLKAREVAEKARGGKLNWDDTTGISITLTSLGVSGVDTFTPIINLPEAAILGVGTIKERPVVKNGVIVPAPTCWLSLSFDHRLVDGYPAAQFLGSLKGIIENPIPYLMEAK